MVMSEWKMRDRPGLSLCEKSLCTFVALFMFHLMVISTAVAQQDYNNVNGYACQDVATCRGYAMYRSESSNKTVRSVAILFNVSARAVANVSAINLTASNYIEMGEALYIPLRCKCTSGIYQTRVKYRMRQGETYWSVANFTFQGLSTSQAIQAANPTIDPANIIIGQEIEVPLRCACPSSQQRENGTRYLLSYSVFPTETLTVISGYFDVSIPDLIAANLLNGVTQVLEAFSTLLVPLFKLTPLNSITFIVPQLDASSPADGNGPGSSSELPNVKTIYKNRSDTPLYVGVAVGASGFILAAFLAALLRKTKGCDHLEESDVENRGILNQHRRVHSDRSDLLDEVSNVEDSDKLVTFTYEELCAATNDFSANHRLQGSVFCGMLNGAVVAIKQIQRNMAQEINILSQIRHQNVIRLIGVCVSDAEHLFLVFEYADNGSLHDCLHSQVAHPSSIYSRSTGLLSWTTRVQIALDIASGLEYIHNHTNPSSVHNDVKSSNILLDSSWHAKVANFGMAKTANISMVTDNIVGTQGYMAPEYMEHGLVTAKADVFSFGVVLLELLTGEEAILRTDEKEKKDHLKGYQTLASAIVTILKEKGMEHEQKKQLQTWMDPRLQEAYPGDIAFKVALMAKACLAADLTLRPSMEEITYSLSNILAATMDWEMSTVKMNRMR